MFTDLPAAPPRGTPIWADPLSARVGRLFQRPRRVAWVYRNPDTSTFRYRVANMVAALNADPDADVGAAWFSELELDAINHLVGRLDAIVITRYPVSGPLQRLIERARHHDVPLIFDSDDLVFDTELVPVVMDAVGADREDFRNWQLWYAYMAQLNTSMRACRSGLTTGATLQERMASYFTGQRVEIIPNFLDRAQQAYSQELLAAKRARGWAGQGPVTLGYFSGTPTHAHDFAVTSPALARLLRSDPDVRLRVVGRLEPGPEFEDLEDQVEVVPFMDYLALQRSIAEVDVNLAPLQHHVFTDCKSNLKYFEAAAVGTWTVASASPAFAASIEDGVTGRVVRAHEWDEALTQAVEIARDPARVAGHAEQAADLAYARYGWDRHADTITAALGLDGTASKGE